MAHKPDAVTRWWRAISLRAKVTGVTVAVLALGLLVAGLGTVPILRGSLIGNIDAQLPALVSTDLVGRYFDTQNLDGVTTYTRRDSPRDFSFAVYDADGVLQTSTGGSNSAAAPMFPSSYSVQEALDNEGAVFDLKGTKGASFRASVATGTGEGGAVRIQLVAMPLAAADRIISQFFGIYITVALITMVIAALLIRGLVTLTFRRLSQVESTAMSIAAGNFSQRLTDLEPTTEVDASTPRLMRCSTAPITPSHNVIAPCSTCAGSSATRVTNCALPWSASAATPSCTEWARSRVKKTPPGPWNASKRKRSAWACSSRTSSRSRVSTRSASSRSPRSTCGRSPVTQPSTSVRQRLDAPSRSSTGRSRLR